MRSSRPAAVPVAPLAADAVASMHAERCSCQLPLNCKLSASRLAWMYPCGRCTACTHGRRDHRKPLPTQLQTHPHQIRSGRSCFCSACWCGRGRHADEHMRNKTRVHACLAHGTRGRCRSIIMALVAAGSGHCTAAPQSASEPRPPTCACLGASAS
jgi:hypothetical protein